MERIINPYMDFTKFLQFPIFYNLSLHTKICQFLFEINKALHRVNQSIPDKGLWGNPRKSKLRSLQCVQPTYASQIVHLKVKTILRQMIIYITVHWSWRRGDLKALEPRQKQGMAAWWTIAYIQYNIQYNTIQYNIHYMPGIPLGDAMNILRIILVVSVVCTE